MKEESAAAIWKALEKQGAAVIYRATTSKDIAAAEKALGVRLPPSYVELVTTLGAPAIAVRVPRVDRKNPQNMPYAMLLPQEIVRETRRLRRELEADQLDEPEDYDRVKRELDRAVFFQFGSNAGEGFVWLSDTVDAHGEMIVGDFSHDYIEELDWQPNGAVFPSLAAATARIAEGIREHLESYS